MDYLSSFDQLNCRMTASQQSHFDLISTKILKETRNTVEESCVCYHQGKSNDNIPLQFGSGIDNTNKMLQVSDAKKALVSLGRNEQICCKQAPWPMPSQLLVTHQQLKHSLDIYLTVLKQKNPATLQNRHTGEDDRPRTT